MKVYNMESPRTGRPVANQFVISDERKLIFQSYNSTIVTLDFQNSIITFGKDWNYSVTTSKYRNEFLSEYFPQLADTKRLKMLAEMVKACGGEIDYQLGAFIYTIKFE